MTATLHHLPLSPKKQQSHKGRMKRPTVAEVEDYCVSRLNGISGGAFVDYYDSCGWVVGRAKKPMVNWQAAVRTWERNSPKPKQPFISRHTNTDWAN